MRDADDNRVVASGVVGRSGGSVAGSTESWDAFISYRRRDGTTLARWIRGRLLGVRLPEDVLNELSADSRTLHQRRPRVWLDRFYERPSDDFLIEKVFPALDRSDRLIVISTPAALEEMQTPHGPEPNWLVREIDRFVARNNELGIQRPIVLILGPGASEQQFPGPLADQSRRDWIDLRAFTTRRSWNPLDEALDTAVAKLVAGLYAVPEARLPDVQRAERRHRVGALLIGLTVAILAAITMTFLAVYANAQQREAAAQRDEAMRQRNLAVARLLASEGYRTTQSLPDRAKMYFLSSIALAASPNAVSGLFSLIQQDPHATMTFLPLSTSPTALHSREDRRVAVGLADGGVILWSSANQAAAAGEQALVGSPPTTQLPGLGKPLIAIAQPGDGVSAIDSDGRLIQWLGPGQKPAIVHTLVSGEQIARRSFDNTLQASIAEDGRTVALPTYRDVVLWTEHRGVVRFQRGDMASGGPVALSADGRRLAYAVAGGGSSDLAMRLVAVGNDSAQEVDLPPLPRYAGLLLTAAFSRDGSLLAVGTQNGFVQVWSVTDSPREVRLLRHETVPQRGAFEVVEHLHVGARALASRFGGAWQLWDMPTGTPLGEPLKSRTHVAAYDANTSFLTVDDRTVVAHDFGINHLRYVACLSSPSELRPEEWREIAGDTPQVRACGS